MSTPTKANAVLLDSGTMPSKESHHRATQNRRQTKRRLPVRVDGGSKGSTSTAPDTAFQPDMTGGSANCSASIHIAPPTFSASVANDGRSTTVADHSDPQESHRHSGRPANVPDPRHTTHLLADNVPTVGDIPQHPGDMLLAAEDDRIILKNPFSVSFKSGDQSTSNSPKRAQPGALLTKMATDQFTWESSSASEPHAHRDSRAEECTSRVDAMECSEDNESLHKERRTASKMASSLTDTVSGTNEVEDVPGCHVSSLVAVALFMCLGVIVAGTCGFVPFYLIGMKANVKTIEFLLSEAMNGIVSITQNSVSMLPAFVHIIAYNYIKQQVTTAADVFFPSHPQMLMTSLLAVLIRFNSSIKYLRLNFQGGLYTEAMFLDNLSTPIGAYNSEPVVTPRYVVNPMNLTYKEPLVLAGVAEFGKEMNRLTGPMNKIVFPWAYGNNSNTRWLLDSVNYTGTYFNYVLPFRVDGVLGYCEAGLSTRNIIQETNKLRPALRKHGRMVVLDYYHDIVLQNSWNQGSGELSFDSVTNSFKPTRIADINDTMMRAAIAAVNAKGGFAKVMKDKVTVLIKYPFAGSVAHLNLTRIVDPFGIDIVVGATVLLSDFDKSFTTARTILFAVSAPVIVLAVIMAVVIAYAVVKPLKRLVPELMRASDLEISNDEQLDAVPGSKFDTSTYSFIAEIRDIQRAYRRLREGLREMKSYVPQAVMTNADNAALSSSRTNDEIPTEVTPSSGSLQPKRDMRLNKKIFNEQVNEFRKKLCTVVLVQLHLQMDIATLRRAIDVVTECVVWFKGCVELLGNDQMLISFGAHAPLPMHASKGCQFALHVHSLLPEVLRQNSVFLVDSNEFMVGTCGANNRNSRVVFGVTHLMEIATILWDIECHVAATIRTTSHLPDYQSIPIECVNLQNSKVPLALCELRLVTTDSDVDQHMADAKLYRAAYADMRRGDYRSAIVKYNGIRDKANVQVQRLLRVCRERYAAHDRSSYIRPTEDVYHFERNVPPSQSTDVRSVSANGHDAFRRKPSQQGRASKHIHFNPSVSMDEGNSVQMSSANNENHKHESFLRREWGGSPTKRRKNSRHDEEFPQDGYDDFSPAINTEDDQGTMEGSYSAPLFGVIANSLSSSEMSGATREGDEGLNLDLPLQFRDINDHQWNRSIKKISEGAFSVVYLGMSEEGEQVAIKCIPRLARSSRDDVEAEIHMMTQLRHPNIVQYISYSVTSSHLAIIMEYVPGGSLHAVIGNFGKLNGTVVRRFMIDIINGLAYLHTGGIVHCDVKPHNMLLGMDGMCKLSDFGSTISEAADMARTMGDELVLRGTALYMAPEVARGERCTPQSDIFSLGVSLMEMLLGRLPWRWSSTAPEGSDEAQLHALFRNDPRFVQCLGRGEVEVDIPDSLEYEAHLFAKACCQLDPAKRPSAQELMSYLFLL